MQPLFTHIGDSIYKGIEDIQQYTRTVEFRLVFNSLEYNFDDMVRLKSKFVDFLIDYVNKETDNKYSFLNHVTPVCLYNLSYLYEEDVDMGYGYGDYLDDDMMYFSCTVQFDIV